LHFSSKLIKNRAKINHPMRGGGMNEAGPFVFFRVPMVSFDVG
jgi:hypothetical protein